MFPTVDFKICGQICGLFVTTTILIFFVCQKKLNIKSELNFLRTLITATITCALDVVSVFFNTLIPQAQISILLSKLYLITMLVYLTSVILYIAGDTLNKKKYNIIFWVWTILGILATTAISFAEIRIVDVYTQGVATYIEYSVAVAVVVFVLIFTVRHRNQMYGDKETVIYIWMASWLLFALIQFFFPKLLLVSFAVAFGVMVIYIKLESIDNIIDRETGLFNWNSYLKYVNNMKLQGQKGSVIYLKPNDTLKKADEKVLRASYKMFNDAIRKRNDIIAFSIRNEYLFVMKKDNLNEIKTFLSEGKRFFPVGADAYSAFYLNNVERIDNEEDLEPLVSYVESKYAESDSAFIPIEEEMIASYYSISDIEEMIKQAVENDSVVVYYQPIYSVKEKKFTSAEALVRILNEEGKLIPPYKFIPIAEKTGQINVLGRIVFEKVCSFIQANDMDDLGLRHINVNLSGTQLSDEDLAETYIQIMGKYEIDPQFIHLEITESANVEQNKTLKKNLDRFLNYGVVFALDDYGTGYSNLNYVVEMPVVTIKFDKQMTDSYFSDAKAKRVMEYSIKMFKSMGLNVVIEGVESKEQLEGLSDMNVEYIQGYYFSEPVNLVSFVNFLREKNG